MGKETGIFTSVSEIALQLFDVAVRFCLMFMLGANFGFL